MIIHPDKRFVGRVRSVRDPVRMLGMMVRLLGPLHQEGDTGALLYHADRVHKMAMRERHHAYYLLRKQVKR